MTQNDTEMTPKPLNFKQLKAAEILATGGREVDAADEVGVHHSSIKRWRRIAAFQEAIAEFQREIHSAAMAQAARHILGAMKQIVALAQSSNTPPAVRLAACRTIIDYVNQHVVTKQLEARLTQLEEMLEA